MYHIFAKGVDRTNKMAGGGGGEVVFALKDLYARIDHFRF